MPVFSKNDVDLLFMHVPKCGGSSVEEMFFHSGWDMSYRNTRPSSYIKISPQHYHMEIAQSIFNFEKFDFIFSVIRDPFDRLISEYKHRNRLKFQKGMKIDFNTWALQAINMAEKDISCFDNHLRPQVDFFSDNCKVFLFEDLHKIECFFKNKFDSSILPLPHSNKFGIEEEVVVNEEVEERVRGFYSEDFIFLDNLH